MGTERERDLGVGERGALSENHTSYTSVWRCDDDRSPRSLPGWQRAHGGENKWLRRGRIIKCFLQYSSLQQLLWAFCIWQTETRQGHGEMKRKSEKLLSRVKRGRWFTFVCRRQTNEWTAVFSKRGYTSSLVVLSSFTIASRAQKLPCGTAD